MLKVVVFDSGYGGDVVADYLSRELGVIEVVRVTEIDLSLENGSLSEICRFSKAHLCSYAGKVDLIVLGGYVVSLALEFLKTEYPQQKFVSVGINYYRILNSRVFPDQIAIMADKALFEVVVRQEVCQELPYSTIILPDCSGWDHLINEGQMSTEILRADLEPHFLLRPNCNRCLLPSSPIKPAKPPDKTTLLKPDVVILLNTHFWSIKSEFEELFGFRVRVIDFRQKLLHDTCRALNLLGVDGCRSK